MAKSKKQKKSQAPKSNMREAKYEQICHEYMEQDELEKLNRKVEERTARMEKAFWEQEERIERRRAEQDRKVMAVGKLMFIIVLSIATIMALGVLGFTVEFMLPVSIVAGFGTLLIGTFRAGYLWHEIKG